MPKIKSRVNTSSLWIDRRWVGVVGGLRGRVTQSHGALATGPWQEQCSRERRPQGGVCPLSRHLKTWMKRNKLLLIAFPNKAELESKQQTIPRCLTAKSKRDATGINAWKVRQTGLTCHLVAAKKCAGIRIWTTELWKPTPQPASMTSDLGR